jgi:hypothetical protein
MKSEVHSVIGHFKTIREFADFYMSHEFRPEELVALIEQFSDASIDLDRVVSSRKASVYLHPITYEEENLFDVGKRRALLVRIVAECDQALAFLESEASVLAVPDLDKLNSLRQDLDGVLKELAEPDLDRNMSEAVHEYESGHFLGSSLISGRVVRFLLDKIPPREKETTINDKIEYLRKNKMLGEGDVEQHMMRAEKTARNLVSHDLKTYSDPTSALSLLTETGSLLKIVAKACKASLMSLD